MKRFILIILFFASLCEGQSLLVAERFKRLPTQRFSSEDEKQFPQAKSLLALSKFLSETADKRTLTKWFDEPILLTNQDGTTLPNNYVTTHYLQDPMFEAGRLGGIGNWNHQNYFFAIKGTNLGILYQRHTQTSKSGPPRTNAQWWGSGYFLARWPEEKLGPYKDYPSADLNEWENQKTRAVLKILWKRLAEDLKE